MTSPDLSQRLEKGSPVQLTPDEAAMLLEAAQVVREENTGIAGMVRILDLGGKVFVQEQTPDRLVLVRPRPNVEAAAIFVENRLQTYERMWDG